MMSTVSVLMPVYNAERYVADAVRSVLGQSFADFEFLIVDDGSTDGSPAILRRFEADDPRIRLISRANTGYVAALNEMLGEAHGEFLARMDADDVAMPDRLERQVAYLRSDPGCVAVGSRALVIDPDGDPLCEWFQERTHEEIDAANLSGARGGAICHPSVMMRRDVVLAVGGYRAAFSPSEDVDLWLRLAEHGRLINLDRPLLKYRCHPTSVGHMHRARQLQSTSDAIAEARRRRGLSADGMIVPSPEPSRPIDMHLRWGWWALGSGYAATARKHARAALTRSPWSLDTWRLLCCAIRGH